jgi:hypothetical protein
VTTLAKAMHTNNSLTKLDISAQSVRGLGSDGVHAITQMLEANSSLLQLDLRQNWLRMEGGLAIAKALGKNSTLVSVMLGGNAIEDHGGFGGERNEDPTGAVGAHKLQHDPRINFSASGGGISGSR